MVVYFSHMPQAEAELLYIKEVEKLDGFGQESFPAKVSVDVLVYVVTILNLCINVLFMDQAFFGFLHYEIDVSVPFNVYLVLEIKTRKLIVNAHHAECFFGTPPPSFQSPFLFLTGMCICIAHMMLFLLHRYL